MRGEDVSKAGVFKDTFRRIRSDGLVQMEYAFKTTIIMDGYFVSSIIFYYGYVTKIKKKNIMESTRDLFFYHY